MLLRTVSDEMILTTRHTPRFEEETGYRSAAEEMRAFQDAYEIGREDAQDNEPAQICGKLPAQRSGYVFGYVGQVPSDAAYLKWINFGRPDA